MDAFVIAQWVDCFGKVGSRVQHDVVLPVKFGAVGTPFQPQGEEGGFSRILPITLEDEWLVPRRYLKDVYKRQGLETVVPTS